jgi:hypothetical protein
MRAVKFTIPKISTTKITKIEQSNSDNRQYLNPTTENMSNKSLYKSHKLKI